MDPSTLVFMIPITAIVLGIGSGIVKSILASQERRLEIRMNAQQGQSEQVAQQLQALRAEVATLRDTSHQFDVSFDEAITRLEQRVGRVETKTAPPIAPVNDTSNILRNGQNS
jgi:hypothetical protein